MRYAVLPLRGEGFFAAAFFGLAAALPGGGFFAGSTSPSSSACPSVRRNLFRTSRTWLARFLTLQPDVSTGGSTVTRPVAELIPNYVLGAPSVALDRTCVV